MNQSGYVLLGYVIMMMLFASISNLGISFHWVFVEAAGSVRLMVVLGLMVVYVEQRVENIENKVEDIENKIEDIN